MIQISHNTKIMMSRKLEYTFVINFTKLDIVKYCSNLLRVKLQSWS